MSASPDGISVAASFGYPSTGRSPALPVSVSPDSGQYSSWALRCQRSALSQMAGTRTDARKSGRHFGTTWLQKMDCGPSSKEFSWMVGGKAVVFGQSWRSYAHQLLLCDRSMAASPPLFPSFLEFSIPLGKDQRLPSQQFVQGGDISKGAVKPHGIVVLDELLNQPPAILQVQGSLGTDAFGLQ